MKVREQFFAIETRLKIHTSAEMPHSMLNYQSGGNNIFDFPFLLFHVDDQWNTWKYLAQVSCVSYGGGGGRGKQWKCGSGGGGRKTIEI